MIDRKRIESEIETTERELNELKARLEDRPEFELGEGSSGVDIWEQTLARKERLEEQLYALRQSLAQTRQGTYGRCSECGAQIDPERLEILPSTTLCANCAREKTEPAHNHLTHPA